MLKVKSTYTKANFSDQIKYASFCIRQGAKLVQEPLEGGAVFKGYKFDRTYRPMSNFIRPTCSAASKIMVGYWDYYIESMPLKYHVSCGQEVDFNSYELDSLSSFLNLPGVWLEELCKPSFVKLYEKRMARPVTLLQETSGMKRSDDLVVMESNAALDFMADAPPSKVLESTPVAAVPLVNTESSITLFVEDNLFKPDAALEVFDAYPKCAFVDANNKAEKKMGKLKAFKNTCRSKLTALTRVFKKVGKKNKVAVSH